MSARPRAGLLGRASSTARIASSSMRPPNSRAASVVPLSNNGRASPADSIASTMTSRTKSPGSRAGNKRKERDFEHAGGEETNINVVVRCRGRNDREVRENSGVVVSTDGVKGNSVDLSMGPSALSNKTYHFDKVFSPAADQGMVFDEVIAPMLDEVLSGFNCTVFAYGQTGTGKTYTMSGDISDTLPLQDAAGIIPRALHALFNKLENDEGENSVKCSFIELYNEELRDLLAPDDNVKLKIYDDNSKKGHITTQVQGMEESHIKSASKGIALLREGSHKRQVAATKCNDLSSRSHTVFTVTIYMKRTSDTGEDFVSAGKLNLVDLAGSENIQRSGAENKRAAEAGLINKSLLTLGRVINALVDRGSHIPYRESKLTRLLQDSLGGRTKTCIIATLSPAKSNLEETISTLDYAFRAKNIRNKPQANQLVSKKTLLKEFTAEIEKLKSELIATRQRNGVYLTAESYEEITTESESRRILSEEQRDKIETMEANLRNKVQELFTLTSNFNYLKKENEATKMTLEGTKGLLEKTEVVLAHTKHSLSQETKLRQAHQATEENLAIIGHELISKLDHATSDIDGLFAKNRRKSELQSTNRTHWASSQAHVTEATLLVEERLDSLKSQQDQLMLNISSRMQEFVKDELENLQGSNVFLSKKAEAFEKSQKEVNEQNTLSRDEMNKVLEEITSLREDVKQKVGNGMNDLSAAAAQITSGIMTELDDFHTQLHASYASIGKEIKTTFDDLVKQLGESQAEANRLRQDVDRANIAIAEANRSAGQQLVNVLEVERQTAAQERQTLLTQVASLVNASADVQEKRLSQNIIGVNYGVDEATKQHAASHLEYQGGMDRWSIKSQDLVEKVIKSRESVKTRIKGDFALANTHTENLRGTTTSVRDSTVKIVDTQMSHLDSQLGALDEIVSRIRAQNNTHHEAHVSSLSDLASTVHTSYSSIGDHFKTSFSRIDSLETDMASRAAALRDTLPSFAPESEIRRPLQNLRQEIDAQALQEYIVTGSTPQRTQYLYPTALPRTERHDLLLSKLRNDMRPPSPSKSSPSKTPRSPTKSTTVFADSPFRPADDVALLPTKSSNSRPESAGSVSGGGNPLMSLRELDPNVITPANGAEGTGAAPASAPPTVSLSLSGSVLGNENARPPPPKRQNTGSSGKSLVVDGKGTMLPGPPKRGARKTAGVLGERDVKENVPMDFSKSVGAGGGRKLRSQGSG